MNILAEIKRVKLFVFDIDGVLTDGSLLVLDNGELVRTMNVKDGYALQLAVKRGYKVLVISGAIPSPVKLRLEKLGVTDVHLGILNKAAVLDKYMQANGFRTEEVLYMGDDMPDIAAMKISGIPCCPSDAVPQVRAISRYISHFAGGKGCVRDVIEKTLSLNGHWDGNEDAIASQ